MGNLPHFEITAHIGNDKIVKHQFRIGNVSPFNPSEALRYAIFEVEPCADDYTCRPMDAEEITARRTSIRMIIGCVSTTYESDEAGELIPKESHSMTVYPSFDEADKWAKFGLNNNLGS